MSDQEWNQRHKIAGTKLADAISADTPLEAFGALLMRPKSDTGGIGPDEDDFVEVHIWGPWTRRTLTHVVVHGKQPTDLDILTLQSKLDQIGVTLELK